MKELGEDPATLLGIEDDNEDSRPVTVGMLKEIEVKNASKSALEMAEGIQDEETRTQVKQFLSDRIRPSGKAEDDFKFALSAASASKNKLILEEVARATTPKRTASGGSQAASVEEEFVPTAQELIFMQPPYNLSKEKIIAARK